MFKWEHVFSTTVDFPIEKVWDFMMDPKNWILEKNMESYSLEEPLKKGSIVKANFKNKKFVCCVFTEVVPYQYSEFFIKVPFFKQNSYFNVYKNSSEETTVVNKILITSILSPFLKSYFSKNLESRYKVFFSKMIQALSD